MCSSAAFVLRDEWSGILQINPVYGDQILQPNTLMRNAGSEEGAYQMPSSGYADYYYHTLFKILDLKCIHLKIYVFKIELC